MRRILSALFAFAWAVSAFAAPFQNGGFETGTLSPDPCNGAIPVGGNAITGWTVILGDVDYLTTACWTPSEGSRSLDLVGSGSVGGIEQTFDTLPGQTYRVTFDLAGNPSVLKPPAVKNLVVAVDGTPRSFTFDTTGHSTTSMGWTTQSFVFVATGSSTTLSFVSDMTPSTFAGAALDNVRVQAVAAVDAWTGSGGQVYSGQAVAYPAVPMICSGPGTNWNELGGGPFSYPPAVTSDGTLGPVVASYNVPQGNTVDGICGSWTASATAATARDVSVAWNYSGFHAFFDVTADLKAFVVRGGSIVQSDYLVAIANPDDQFTFSGPYTFHVQPGDVYGFTMTGSNFDSTDVMSGTLYLTGTLATSLNAQSSANPAPVGSPVTFSATVTGSSPVGNVTFSDGATPIAGCEAVPLVPVDATQSAASCSVLSLSPGAHVIGLAYGGDMTNARSSNTIAQTTAVPLATPVLIRALPAGSFSLPLIGRVDGASSLPITVRLYGGTTCVDGVLGGTVAPIGVDMPVTTDASGYFGTLQGGAQGQFVAIGVTLPQVTALSACVVTSADNDTWPKALRLTGASTSVSDWIDAPGKARWYKFSVIPGQSIQVTMSNLPADYDLAVFKDIGSEFLSELVPVNAAQLTKLSAEYAPSAFSPSAFSPSAFSPSAFSPSAFSPSAFSPSAFSPSAFSPSAFSPSAFSPSAFSPSAFSPSAFSPSAFSPSAFSPSAFSPSAFSPSAFSTDELGQAFSSAQTRSIIATSMTSGTGNESVVVDTWNNTGDFYVRVTGRAGAFSPAAYSLAVTKQGTSCAAVTDTAISTARAASGNGYATIVLVDSSKTPLSAPVAGGSLGSKLAAFVQRADVHGVLVDVATDARVSALKAQASANASCPFAKNLVAGEIKSIVDAYLMTNPLRYVVIVGNDDAIPFFRYPDQSLLGEESGYVPPVSSASASEASLRGNFVLGQDGYGATTHISLGVVDFPIMGLAVGRLVETPAEIAGMIDAYVAANGSVSPASSLVTGYDFLQDDADAVRTELEAGTGHPADALITANTVSPADTRTYASGGPWTANDLRQQLLGTRHDVVFLAGHFNANSALAADFTTSIITSELAASDVFTNAVVFSAGCHSGYNLVDSDAINGVTFPLDWAQAFAQRKATLIAGTGYQYGDTDFLEYSERLYLNFAKELRAGTGAVAVGEALVKAKLAYLAATPDLRGLHEKALLEATLFGLPMLGVNMPTGRTTPVVAGTVSPVPVDGGPAATLGLRIADVSLTPVLTPHTAVLNNFDVQPPATTTATWLSGPDGIVTHPVEPALPLARLDATPDDPALVLRGVGFRGAAYSDSTVLPLTGAPTTELRGVHIPFSSPVFFPMRLWSANYFGALSGGGGTNLLVTPAQHRTPDAASGTSTLRQYSRLDLELFYSGLVACDKTTPPSCSGATGDPAFAAAALSDAPTIVHVDAVPNGGLTTFSAQVVGDPAAAMHAVWVTYTSAAGGNGTWTSVDLQQCAAPLPAACGGTADSQYWKAAVATASLPSDARYIVQAVNGVGLVSLDDNLGRYYGIASAAPAPTVIALNAPVPTSAVYGDSPSITARLSVGSSPLAGEPVTIAVGGTARTATTDATGTATVQLPMLAAPGAYPVTASFAGDDAFLSSSVSAASRLTVGKAVTTLAPLAGRVGAVLTASIGGKAQPLIQRPVQFWISGPGGVQQVFATTDYNGFAAIPPPGSPAGTYSVIQACFAGDATYLGATLNASMTCSYRFAGFFQPVDNTPTLNSMKAGQSVPVKFSLGGNRGLAILAINSPASQAVSCNGFTGTSTVEETGTAGSSSLQYDAGADQYTYVWKTDKAWAGTCRVLVLTLNDGSQYGANFQFK